MDVFNLALRNPLPPARKEADKSPKTRKKENGSEIPKSTPSNGSSPGNSNSENGSTSSQTNQSNAGETSHSDEEDPYRKRKTSRRKHRNSHLGCGTCKKRRIKCDENLPQCFNCVKGKLHCAYLNLDAPARNALRLAQYNQNLRQDNVKDKKDENGSNGNTNNNTSNNNNNNNKNSKEPITHILLGHLPHHPVAAVAGAPPVEHVQAYMPYQIVTQPSLDPQAPPTAVPVPHQAPPGTTATILQSPYGPLLSFQPVGAVAYSPVPVQIMAPQVPVMYEDPSLMPPMQAAPHPPPPPPPPPAAAPPAPATTSPLNPLPSRGTASMTNLPPTKNSSYTDLSRANMAPTLLPSLLPLVSIAGGAAETVPPPQLPQLVVSDPAHYSSMSSANGLPANGYAPAIKQEHEPVKLPSIQTQPPKLTTHSTVASAGNSVINSHAPSKNNSAASSSVTSPVLHGNDKVPSISKLLS